MMFHVKPLVGLPINKGKLFFFLCSLILISCVGARQTTQIPDYILAPGGKQILGNKEGLTAFIFENNTKNLPIERYFAMKFKTENYLNTEYWITIDRTKYKLILYDHADFEKYFNSANYSVINLEPQNEQSDQQRKFIALSLINVNNEDCLREGSLFQNIAVNYLKQLKDEYYNQ